VAAEILGYTDGETVLCVPCFQRRPLSDYVLVEDTDEIIPDCDRCGASLA
jgi:hypothetical protein